MCSRCNGKKICFIDYLKQNIQTNKRLLKNKKNVFKPVVYVCSLCGERYICQKRKKNYKIRYIRYNAALILYGIFLLYCLRKVNLVIIQIVNDDFLRVILSFITYIIYMFLVGIFSVIPSYVEWKLLESNIDENSIS